MNPTDQYNKQQSDKAIKILESEINELETLNLTLLDSKLRKATASRIQNKKEAIEFLKR